MDFDAFASAVLPKRRVVVGRSGRISPRLIPGSDLLICVFRVLDDDGAIVVGAQVYIWDGGSGEDSHVYVDEATDEKGEVTFPFKYTQDIPVTVRIRHPQARYRNVEFSSSLTPRGINTDPARIADRLYEG